MRLSRCGRYVYRYYEERTVFAGPHRSEHGVLIVRGDRAGYIRELKGDCATEVLSELEAGTFDRFEPSFQAKGESWT